MVSSSLILAALAAVVSAAPRACRAPPALILPKVGGDPELPPPATNLRVKKIALGHGIQNYTCASPDAEPAATGAIAVLYDVTTLFPGTRRTGISQQAWDAFPSTVLRDQPLPLNTLEGSQFGADPSTPFPAPADLSVQDAPGGPVKFLGHHFFDAAGVPVFDLSAAALKAAVKKDAAIPAPANADKGPLDTGAVAWLKLDDNGTGQSKGLATVFRVITAGGGPQACASVGEGTQSVPYATYYWFYGLLNLSLASKACRRATTAGRHSRIRFTIRDKEKLRRDLNRVPDYLLCYVRRVTVVGGMLDGDEGSSPDHREDGASLAEDSDDETDDLTQRVDFDPEHPMLTPEHKQAQHEAWLPFAEFLGRLPPITDFVYSCKHQIPACVLAALHHHHPTSRLHVSTFSFRSLYQPAQGPYLPIDPDEYALVTSPCLYSIRLITTLCTHSRRYSHNLAAIRHMLRSKCAPQLRHVLIHHRRPPVSPREWLTLRQIPRTPWNGFFGEPTPSQVSAPPGEHFPLETLVVTRGSWSDSSSAGDLHDLIDLGTLRRFECHYHMWENFRRSLQRIICHNPTSSNPRHSPFHSLRSLSFGHTGPYPTAQGFADMMDPSAVQFLSTLPPLQELTWTTHMTPSILETILSHHGPTLRKLHFPIHSRRDCLTATHILSLTPHCPRLEDIRLRLRRDPTNHPRAELAVYRALGRLPAPLRKARLVLDCLADGDENCHLVLDEDGLAVFHEGDEAKKHAYPFKVKLRGEAAERIRATLRSLAMDEKLARGIWGVIAREQQQQKQQPALERLVLEPKVDGGVWGGWNAWEQVEVWGRWVGRKWDCKKAGVYGIWHGTDEEEEEVVVSEFGCDDRERQKWLEKSHMVPLKDEDGVDLWTSIWPPRGENWWDDWHNFPLSTEEDENGEAV
ncbi:hypothetical protein VTJ49DRAFT_3870 [Mycothermus thermophilus]|uniref:F-box domain-containing protein n=1 Tax=Humicola insolens TaxID=85995 RepID=A0ABR3VQM3_HUMIN